MSNNYKLHKNSVSRIYGKGKSDAQQVTADILCPILYNTMIKHNCIDFNQIIAMAHVEYYTFPVNHDRPIRLVNGDIDEKSYIAQEHHLHWTLGGVRMDPDRMKTLFAKTKALPDGMNIEDDMDHNRDMITHIKDKLASDENYTQGIKWNSKHSPAPYHRYMLQDADFVLTKVEYDFYKIYLKTEEETRYYWESRKNEDKIMQSA
tara:strand:+ start:97 stop:711 length:615 start_codon:yes stop_codon:yes gene_type:complete